MKAERQQKEAFPRAIQYEKKNRAYMVDNRFNAIKQTKLLNNCLSEKRNKEFETTKLTAESSAFQYKSNNLRSLLKSDSTSVIQLLMSQSEFLNKVEFDVKLGYIADKIQQYHESKNIVERQKKLANLGVKVFLWLSTNSNYSKNNTLDELLDDMQIERNLIVKDLILQNNVPEWMDDFEDKPEGYDELWNKIVTQSGNLKIHGEDYVAQLRKLQLEQCENFRDHVLSDISRLISKPNGFNLINSIMNNSNQVHVVPKTKAVNGLIDNVLDVKHQAHENLFEPAVSSVLPISINPSDISYARNMSQINVSQGKDGVINFYEDEGGSASIVAIDPMLRDSDIKVFNKAGKEILSPTFITLGHELQHAEHNIKGHNTGHIGSLDENYPNLEEWLTIRSENQLREEHVLEKRYGHEGHRL